MLGPLKAGDVVGLQLLWADRVKTVHVGRGPGALKAESARFLQREPLPVAVPTNRVNITLTAHLLSVAGR